MAEDRDVIPYENRSNQDNLSYQINGGAPKALDDNSVGGLSLNPLGAFGNRSKNSSNGFEKEFDMCGLPKRPALDSIDNSFDNDLFFGSRLDAPPFISPMNKNTKKRQNTQYPSMQPQFASNVAGSNNMYGFNQLPAGEGGYIKPLEPQPVLTEQEIQQQSSRQAQMKQFHKNHDMNCGCGQNFKCDLHKSPKRAGSAKTYDQFAANSGQDYGSKLITNVHQYNPMLPYNLNPQGQNVMGQQRYTQEQIQQAQSQAYSQGKRDRSKLASSSRSALQAAPAAVNPQYQNPGQPELSLSQNQLTQYNLVQQQQAQQQQILQLVGHEKQRRLQQAQNQPQAWQQQQLLLEGQSKRRQKELEAIPNASAQIGGIKPKMVTTEQPQAKVHISIPTQLLTGIESGSQQAHGQQSLQYSQLLNQHLLGKKETKADNQPQGIAKNSPTGRGMPRKQVISIDFITKPTKPAPIAKTSIKVQEIPVYQPQEKPRAATIVIPRMEPQIPITMEREQSQAKATKPEPKVQTDSQIVSKNFSNNADSQVSSIQNSYDDGMSANSNKADLGNKHKVEFTQDNASIQVVKPVQNIIMPQAMTMTINEESMAGSRLVNENLMVSFALGNPNRKAKNQAMVPVADKRKDQTESFNNQSFAGKSKNSRLVTIPIGDTNREVSCLLGSVDQSKEAPKRQKVSISFNQSDKKPTARAEIIIPAPPVPIAASIQVPLDAQGQSSTNNVQSQDGGSVLKQILKNQITNKSTFVAQPVGDQYKHLQKQDVQSTTTSKLNVSLPIASSSTQLNDMNTLQNLLPSMIYQQTQNTIPQNLMTAPLSEARTSAKHQPGGDWLKQRHESNLKYNQSYNSNFANYKIEQGQNSDYFEKPGTQRRNRFNLGNQQQNQGISQTRSTKAKEHQQQDHSMRPPDLEQFQMDNQLSGSQKLTDLAKQISYDLSSEFRDNVNLQNDIRFRIATAAAQAAQATKLPSGQQSQQLKYPQHHQEQSQSKNASNNNGNRSRVDAQSAGPRPQNSGSMTARQGSTPNNQVSASAAGAGGNYDASSHHNISIGNFIRQDVIVNIHMGNMAIANPGAKDARPQQPQADAEAARLSQARSGKANSGQNLHAQQQELGQAIFRHQMESSNSRDQPRDPKNSSNPPMSAEARSTVAIASEHLHHEMTMSIASSKHLNFAAAKIELPVLVAPPIDDVQQRQKGSMVVSKSISSQESSLPASSMQAQPGSSNSNSQQTEAALTLISTFQQLMQGQGQAHQVQELKLPRGQNPLHQVNYDNAPPTMARMDGAQVSNKVEQEHAAELMSRQPPDHAFLSKVQDSLQQLHRIEQTEHIEKLITLTRGLQANQQQSSPPDSQKPLPAPQEDLPVMVQQVVENAQMEQSIPALSGGPSEERKSEEVVQPVQEVKPKRGNGRGRGTARGAGRGGGRGGGRGRGGRGAAAAAARTKIEEASKAAASPQRQKVEEVIPRSEPVEQQPQVKLEVKLEEIQPQNDPDPTSQSAYVQTNNQKRQSSST